MTDAEQGGIAFVMNLASLEEDFYDLAPGHLLRRGSAQEISLIKTQLNRFNTPDTPFDYPGSLWERQLIGPTRPVRPLPESEWRYFVIDFKGTNECVANIQLAANLATIELEIAFTLVWFRVDDQKHPGLVWHPDHLFHTLAEMKIRESGFCAYTTINIQELKLLYGQLQRCSHDTLQLVTQLSVLKGLPHYSPLRFLGYFALLEAVLTHAPKPEDRYDSIIRQVKKKLALLDNRWARRIDYGPFSGASPEKIWGAMYAYRSAIAHGGTPDFHKDLKLLGSAESALCLIKETAKAVLRQTLLEPRLVADLREC